MSQTSALPPWNQVCLQFMNRLQEMQQSGYLCDLIFELKSQKFRAHKAVISAWSPLIYKLLGEGQGTPETVRIQYDNAEVFSSFLAFLYSCRMESIAEDNVVQMLHLAASLQVTPVRQVCEELLQDQLKISNIISTFHLARKYRLPNLEEYTMAYLQMNLPEAVKQADFLSLSPPRFNSFLSSGWVCVMKPEVKLFLIISWLGFDVKERQQYLVLLLKYIDWSIVADDFLNEISQTENFFTTNESSLYLLLQTLFSSMIPLGPYVDSFPALREKHSYLLDHIVQNSFVFPLEVDDFSPLSVHVVPSLHPKLSAVSVFGNQSHDQSVRHTEAELPIQLQKAANRTDQTSLDLLDTHDLSNDSVTAGIGLRMKKVAIAESQDPCSEDALFSGHASSFDDRQDYNSTMRNENAEEPEVHLPSDSPESLSIFRSAPPSSVLEMSPKRKKGSNISTQKVSPKAKMCKTLKSKMSGSGKLDKPSEKYVAAKSTPIDVQRSDSDRDSCRVEDSGSSTQLNRRPKRQAAANFSVPEKLIPRKRKTKAVLKEVTIAPVAESLEELELSRADDSEHEENRDDDDDDDDDDDVSDTRDHEEDTKKDPDFRMPRKRNPPSKTSSRRQKDKEEMCTKTSETAVRDDTFTSIKPMSSFSVSQSMRNEVLSAPVLGQHFDLDKAVQTGEYKTEQINEDREEQMKNVKRGYQWKRKCEQCDYSAPTQRRLENHIERVHGSRATLYACTMCSFECIWSKKFFEHMQTHHPGPPYVCDFDGCGWETERIQNLLIHRRCHVDERPYKCPQCLAKFRTRNNLIAHFKCHADKKNHECPVCRRRFKMKNTMQQHLVTHSDARPYLCDICGFSTKFQSHLISHKRIHTGEVFTCNFINCTYSSPKRSQLKAHMRSHLNIRHHICDVCQKSFVEKSHLVRHLKIHLDERPHKCDQCEYSSTRIDKVNEHKRKYHSEEAAKNKRRYKYAPRGKNRVPKEDPQADKKTSARTVKKLSPLPSSITTPLPISGRPILPKNPANADIQPILMKPSIAALVSAAEELGLVDMIKQSDGSQVNKTGRNGKNVKAEIGNSLGHIQVALGNNGEVLVKDEEPEVSRLVMDLPRSTCAPEKSRTSGRVRKQNSKVRLQQNVSSNCVTETGMRSKAEQIQHSADVPQTQGIISQPSHPSAALLKQLAASAARQNQQSQSSVTLLPNTILLPHTATPEVQAASHILASARQQHSAAVVSAADSLASMSSGFGLPVRTSSSVTETSMSCGISQASGHQQQGAVSGMKQQLLTQPQHQSGPPPDDCGGLKAFFDVLG